MTSVADARPPRQYNSPTNGLAATYECIDVDVQPRHCAGETCATLVHVWENVLTRQRRQRVPGWCQVAVDSRKPRVGWERQEMYIAQRISKQHRVWNTGIRVRLRGSLLRFQLRVLIIRKKGLKIAKLLETPSRNELAFVKERLKVCFFVFYVFVSLPVKCY